MAAEPEQPRPQQPAQHEQQPSLHNEADSSVSAAGLSADGPSTDGSNTDGAAQPNPEADSASLSRSSDTTSLASIPSDAPSEQEEGQEPEPEQELEPVTSPSVSSPPYWTHSRARAADTPPNPQRLLQAPSASSARSHNHGHNHGHARGVSSASVESVLPPGAITLQDNERDEDEDGGGRRSNSSELYGRDRNRACWARSVQVTDHVLVNGSATNIGAFVVWLIRVETLNVGLGLAGFCSFFCLWFRCWGDRLTVGPCRARA